MFDYIIFIKAPMDLTKQYYRNSRRGEKAIHFTGSRAELLEKVSELSDSGNLVLSVCTALGTRIYF